MIDFSTLKGLTLPEGSVKEIAIGGVTVWKNSISVGSLAVGSSVFMNVSGAPREFLVVHQGIPDSTIYDSSCNGTWLLMKTIYTSKKWDSTDNDYENSDIHAYLNGSFFDLFDSGIQGIIKQVKLPYTKGKYSKGSLKDGSNGISAKVFFLSLGELVNTNHRKGWEGKQINYYANLGGLGNDPVNSWWLRSPHTSDQQAYMKGTDSGSYSAVTTARSVRPALILPSDALVDANFNVIG